MELIEIKKEIEGSKFEYSAVRNGRKMGSIKGSIQNPKILWLWRYEKNDEESVFFEKLQKKFYSDCLENKCKILLEINEKTEQAKYFMDKSKFVESHISYVFENDLLNLKSLSKEFELLRFQEIPLLKYQKIYYESSKGDPQIDLSNLSSEEFFNQDKKELGDLWDENLMHLVSWKDEIIGVLNLRTMPHPKTRAKEGSINYLGLLPNQRQKGYGEILHLTGLHKLKALGCKSYYGGTDSQNQAMLKIFEKNNCERAEEKYCYKIEK